MQLLALLFSLFVDDAHADAFLKTAPTSQYMTSRDIARDHIAVAFAVGLVTNTRPTQLLALAYFESDYKINAVTIEEAGKVSCGTMTPEPMARCTPTDLVSNYLVGARHLRGWLDSYPRDERTALLGYGGGFRAIKRCRVEPAHPKCSMPETRWWRERLIKEAWRVPSTALRWGA